MMKNTIFLFTVAASFSCLCAAAAPALAAHDCSCARSTQRYQEERLEDERDREIDALRDSVDQQKDQLRSWYKAEKEAMEAEYKRVRRCLDGSARRQLARDYDDRGDALRHFYYQQRATLRKGRSVAESQIRDSYRQMERSLEHGVVLLDSTGAAEAIAPSPPDFGSSPEPIPVPPPISAPTLAPTLAPAQTP